MRVFRSRASGDAAVIPRRFLRGLRHPLGSRGSEVRTFAVKSDLALLILHATANADLVFFDNPKMIFKGLAVKKGCDVANGIHNVRLGLVRYPQHNDTLVLLRRIGPDIREIHVERY